MKPSFKKELEVIIEKGLLNKHYLNIVIIHQLESNFTHNLSLIIQPVFVAYLKPSPE
jgi:hypothetical protein